MTEENVLRQSFTQCGTIDADHPHDGGCTLPADHPRWQDDGDGDIWDHARLDASGEMVTGWNVPTDDATPHNCMERSPHGDGCTLTRGHEGLHERHFAGERRASWPAALDTAEQIEAQVAFTVDGTIMTTARAGDSRCDAVAPNSAARCCYRADHPPLVVGGVQYDHHVPGVVSWNMPHIEPPQLRCESQPEPFGWADRDTRCTLAVGHKGFHRDGAGSWGAHQPSRTPWNAMRILDDPRPVRVRFVDLPSLPAPHSVSGRHAQGFALVVDRFRDQAHRDREKAMWEDVCRVVSAKTLLLYVGTLDIEQAYPE